MGKTTEPLAVQDSLSNLEKMEVTLRKHDEELTLLSVSDFAITMPETIESGNSSSSDLAIILSVLSIVLAFGMCYCYLKQRDQSNKMLQEIWDRPEKRLPGIHDVKDVTQSDAEESDMMDFIVSLDNLEAPPDSPISEGTPGSHWLNELFVKNRLKELGTAWTSDEEGTIYSPRDGGETLPNDSPRVW